MLWGNSAYHSSGMWTCKKKKKKKKKYAYINKQKLTTYINKQSEAISSDIRLLWGNSREEIFWKHLRLIRFCMNIGIILNRKWLFSCKNTY